MRISTKMKIYVETFFVTMIICLIAYLERGYFAIGGEWIIAVAAAILLSVIEIKEKNEEMRGNYHE